MGFYFKQLDNGKTRFLVDLTGIEAKLGGFPLGRYLEIEAIVYEEATGKEEANKDSSVIFADSPFYFKFTSTKKSYRPGIEYSLKV